jgi:CheY-like chemotaxis protein
MKSGLILLGEDQEDDVFLFHRVVSKSARDLHVVPMDDGEEIHAYLNGAGKYADRAAFPIPEAIFLDGQLHHQPSFGLLRWIRRHPDLQKVPVFVLSGSLDPQVAAEAMRLGAAACLQKPFTAEDWQAVEQTLAKQ